jgi:hypothetical protein
MWEARVRLMLPLPARDVFVGWRRDVVAILDLAYMVNP